MCIRDSGYPDFMLKEIHEQPRVVRDTLVGRMTPAGELDIDDLDDWVVDFFRRNDAYKLSVKENFLYMKQDLEKFTQMEGKIGPATDI